MVYTVSRLALAFIWLWHGLVPKLIVRHPDEFIPLTNVGIAPETAEMLVTLAGWGEIAFGVVILIFWKARWPLWLSIGTMIGLLISILFTAPELALGAFTPVTLNVLVIAVALIGLWSQPPGQKAVS